MEILATVTKHNGMIGVLNIVIIGCVMAILVLVIEIIKYNKK